MIFYWEDRHNQLCDQLREIEQRSEDNDELFYCSYLLSLLGLHDGKACLDRDTFDLRFYDYLLMTMKAENLSYNDQRQIQTLWQQVSTVVE